MPRPRTGKKYWVEPDDALGDIPAVGASGSERRLNYGHGDHTPNIVERGTAPFLGVAVENDTGSGVVVTLRGRQRLRRLLVCGKGRGGANGLHDVSVGRGRPEFAGRANFGCQHG